MAEHQNDCKIFTSFMPPLRHLAVLKISFPLFREFYIHKLITRNMQGSAWLTAFQENSRDLPDNLILNLIEAIFGRYLDVKWWLKDHSKILTLTEEESVDKLLWRPTGEVDRVGTAEKLVEDESIDIENRLELACMYFLEDSVQKLWAEMEATGKTNDFVPVENSTVSFWIRWMQDGWSVPCIQVIPSCLNPNKRWNVRFSRFFPLLQPKDREVFLPALLHASNDDLRFCLTAMTSTEEKQMLRLDNRRLFTLYMDWPCHHLLLEIFEKTADSIDFDFFHFLLRSIYNLNVWWGDVLYFELLLDLWNTTPTVLKQQAKQNPQSKSLVDTLRDGYNEVRQMLASRRRLRGH